MKQALLLIALCLAVWPVQTKASCEDMECAAKAAAQARSEQTQRTLNTVMPAPEENRSALTSCLDSLNAVGDSFSMGVSVPSMDQILESICRDCNSYIDSKIHAASAEVENEIEGVLGTNHPFQVGMSASNISNPLMRKLK
ncbi:MAG: hypothetical protein IJU37_10365 [Desulfovibrio sp.]|jgi:hypothetical protein|nr:hypothetical protein [Desulfovibrio sp.]